MKLNVATHVPAPRTAEGGIAARTSAEQVLMRCVMTCLLWEKNAYSDGKSVADLITANVPLVSPEFAAAVAFHARTVMKLRHVPLLVVREMARHPEHKKLVAKLLPDVIQRPDEITEFVAIYWKDKPDAPLSNQVKKGLAAAFLKFNEYQLAKWNRDGDVRLRDVMLLVHGRTQDTLDKTGAAIAAPVVKPSYSRGTVLRHEKSLAHKLVNNTLATPETWEVMLSGGADKKAVFEGLMLEKKLGAQAFLMNLRNMDQAGVDRELMKAYSEAVNIERVLPYQFLTAARIMPKYEDFLEPMMLRCLASVETMHGKTVLLVDVSGSMDAKLSAKGEMTRVDAATGVGVLLREQCEEVEVWTFSAGLVQVPPRRGFALRDAIVKSQHHSSTYLGAAVRQIDASVKYDRLIVITDEQSHDTVPPPKGLGYLINVASEKHGVGYGRWNHIDGWSEKVIDFILAFEKRGEE